MRVWEIVCGAAAASRSHGAARYNLCHAGRGELRRLGGNCAFQLWYGSRCLLGARALPRSNWSRPLPQPLVVPTVMTLRTLDDVRELLRHLPEENRSKAAWRYVASQLDKAATGTLDTVEVEIALRLVLMLEGVKCRPR